MYYTVVEPTTSKIIKSKNVSFVESKVYGHFYGVGKKTVLGTLTFKIERNNDNSFMTLRNVDPTKLLFSDYE